MIFALAMGLILLFIFMGVSIPLSFLSGSFFLAIFAGARTGSFATNAYYMLDSIAMLAIPLFVVGGQLVEKSGIANVLIEVGDRLLRKVKGGMAAAIPVVSCFFGAMCGSALATANTLATAMAPDMVKKGWDKRYVAALIAASSPMGFMIPPNVNAIVFSTAVSGASVGELFMSTIIPAIIWTGLYLLINRLIYTQYYDPTKRSDYVSEKVETGEATPSCRIPAARASIVAALAFCVRLSCLPRPTFPSSLTAIRSDHTGFSAGRADFPTLITENSRMGASIRSRRRRSQQEPSQCSAPLVAAAGEIQQRETVS